MKILAAGDKETFICEASADELANLIGYYYAGSEAYERIKVGQEIHVAQLYRQLYKMKDLEPELKRMQGVLMDVFENLTLLDPIVGRVKEKKENEIS
jgi:hypothetical protein